MEFHVSFSVSGRNKESSQKLNSQLLPFFFFFFPFFSSHRGKESSLFSVPSFGRVERKSSRDFRPVEFHVSFSFRYPEENKRIKLKAEFTASSFLLLPLLLLTSRKRIKSLLRSSREKIKSGFPSGWNFTVSFRY